MTPLNKYLLNAAIEWIVDNDYRPHIVVDTTVNGVAVPQDYINEDGSIVLNISPGAVRDFLVDDMSVSFDSRFNGKVERIYLPMQSIRFVTCPEESVVIPLPPMEVVEEPKDDKPNTDDGSHLRLV